MPSPSARKPGPPDRAVPSGDLDAVFGALSHPARRQILIILHSRGGGMSAGEIADRFKHFWPTTTRHLGVLERAGVLEVRRNGRQRLYALRPRHLVAAVQWLHGWAALAPEDPDVAGRPAWTSLPYATQRSTIPPGLASDKGRR